MTEIQYVKKGTNKSARALKQINETIDILVSFGIPVKGLTERRLEKMAIAFLAVSGMSPKTTWNEVKSNLDNHRLTTREVISYINKNYGENISSGSYDDVRRKDLKLLTVSGVIFNSANNPNAAINNPTRRYALNPDHAEVIKTYGSVRWDKNIKRFMRDKKSLADDLSGKRRVDTIPIQINGKQISFSPGLHNQIQKAIIEEFLPRYGYGAEILYVGDTSDKFKHIDKKKLSKINFFEISHGELPDVIAYSERKNWLYLIEAVHSANPINPLRHHELKRLTKNCTAGVVYITAFLDRKSSQKFIGEIAWETEVWVADNPDHLIHFNGQRFLGPYTD